MRNILNVNIKQDIESEIGRISFISDKLGKSIQLKVAVSAIRTVEKKGGLDEYLLKTSNTKLPMEALKIKKQILSISK